MCWTRGSSKKLWISVSDLLLSDMYWTTVWTKESERVVSYLLLYDKYKHPLTALISNEGFFCSFSLQLVLLQCNLARFCSDNSSFALIASLHSLLPHHAPQLAFCCVLLLLIDNLSLKLIKGLERLLWAYLHIPLLPCSLAVLDKISGWCPPLSPLPSWSFSRENLIICLFAY